VIEWLVIAAVAALAGVVVSLSNDVRQSVAAWLRAHHLAETALMDAWILLDATASGVRVRLRLTTRRYGTQEIVLDRVYRPDQIDDPQVRALLQQRSHAKIRILDQTR
jgi:hypothetical protein